MECESNDTDVNEEDSRRDNKNCDLPLIIMIMMEFAASAVMTIKLKVL